MPLSTVGGSKGGRASVFIFKVVVAFAPGSSVLMMACWVGTTHDCVQLTTGLLIPQVSSKAKATRTELKPSILQEEGIRADRVQASKITQPGHFIDNTLVRKERSYCRFC